MTDNHIEDVLLLESIRAGIPSRLMIDKLPDLRNHITEQIDVDLTDLTENKRTQGRIIWGEYGQGKTHFLKMIEQHVLQQGFAVSYYTLNRDLGLNNLKTLFPMLAEQTLTGSNKIPGIMNQLTQDSFPDSFYEDLHKIESKISHPLPSLILQGFLSFHDADEMMVLYNSIMGNSSYWVNAKSIIRKILRQEMKTIPRFTMREHSLSFFEFYSYLLKLLGYKGWVILIDEIELIGKLGMVGRLNSYKNLSYLLNSNNEHNLPIYTLAASAKTLQTDVFYSRKNDFEKMPEAAKERFDSKSALQMANFFEMSVKSKRNLILNPIDKSHYYALFTAILQLHQQAIKWKKPAEDNLIEEIEKIIRPDQKPIRISVRMFIELLGIYACHGQLLNSIKDDKIMEHDLNEEESYDENLRSGFTEKPLDEMFDKDIDY